jgi:surface polysaccharide O-acyltransferase-like enzyme
MTRRLLLLNGLAILALPLHHAAAYGLQAMVDWANRYMAVDVPYYGEIGSPAYVILTATRLLMGFAVPAFLFVSGFYIAFLARGPQSKVTHASVLPRIKVLLIPFFVWTLIRHGMIRSVPTTVEDFLDPYHFIPLLIQFYLLAPFIVPAAKRNWKALLAVAAFVHLFGFAMRYLNLLGVAVPGQDLIVTLTPRWFFLTRPLWFPMGVVVGLNVGEVRKRIEPLRHKLLAAVLLFAVLTVLEYFLVDYLTGPDWIGPVFAGIGRFPLAISLIFCVLAYDSAAVPYSKEIMQIAPKSLGIYLGNIPAIYAAAFLMYHLTPWALGMQWIYQPLLILAGLGGPLLFMRLVETTPARPGYRLLFG